MSQTSGRDFSKYDSMETEELEEFLRLDSETPVDDESDVEELLYILEVLNNRKGINSHKKASEAWDSFQRNYLSENKPDQRTLRRNIPFVRRLTAAAVVIALLLLVPVTANAFSLKKLWDIFARWAKETFSFVSGDNIDTADADTQTTLEYTSFQHALMQNNVDINLIPSWIPESYELETIVEDINPVQERYLALYRGEGKVLKICVNVYLSEDPEKIEVSDNPIEIYESNESTYYLFQNVAQVRAVWIDGIYECYISGEITIEELKMMIDSIRRE